jgi:hypothetical protein
MSIKNFTTELVKDSPIVGLGGVHVLGLSLPDWVLAMGLAYGALRLWLIAAELYWKYKDRKNGARH